MLPSTTRLRTQTPPAPPTIRVLFEIDDCELKHTFILRFHWHQFARAQHALGQWAMHDAVPFNWMQATQVVADLRERFENQGGVS